MNVGELFITLGLKGGDKTSKELSGVKNTLGQVSTSALAVKAAIVGVVYGLERIMSSSMATGAGLSNFGSLTDLSTKKLQQWQFAARQAGVSSDSMMSSVKGVQSAMTKMLMGEGRPKGMSHLQQLTDFDISKANDTFYVMTKLTELSQKMKGGIGLEYMRSFNLSDDVIQAMKRGVFNERMFNAAPIYSDREIKNLSNISVAWENLQEKFKMSIGRLTAKEGLPMIKELDKAAVSVIKLMEAFANLNKELHIFEIMGAGISTIGDALNNVAKIAKEATSIFSSFNEAETMEDKKQVAKDVFGWIGEMTAQTIEGVGDSFGIETRGFTRTTEKPIEVMPKVNMDKLTDINIKPKMQEFPFARGQSSQNINIRQDLHFNHDGADPRKNLDSHKKASVEAFRQIQQGQAN